jgi:formylglycine-generating enzyme required for sulfatase activity
MGPPRKRGWLGRPKSAEVPIVEVAPFTQLDGKWIADRRHGLHEPLTSTHGVATLARRQTDGMVCARVPAAQVEFRDGDRTVGRLIESFLIDVEPVSASAYCRFLNTIGPVADRLLAEWFISAPGDGRAKHQIIEKVAAINPWRPVRGCERWPMILISWYGANAYSLWATGGDWYGYRDAAPDGTGSALPTEDEWEYAARGATVRRFPWGDAAATPERCAFGRHARGQDYPTAHALPIEPVNRPLGVSPFGLRHMAGNVWQWCANEFGPGLRAERGGSWIGPAFLCESSYRRGRVPDARGRCLGFRCVSRE